MQRVFKIFIKIVIIHFYGLWAINHPFIADRIKIDCALYCRLFKHCTLRNGLHDFISHDSYSYIPFYSLFARLQKYFFFEIIPGFISKCLKMAKNCPILIFDPSFWFTKKLTLQIILHRFIPKRFSLLLRITISGSHYKCNHLFSNHIPRNPFSKNLDISSFLISDFCHQVDTGDPRIPENQTLYKFTEKCWRR